MTDTTIEERWKAIRNFEDYEVSTLGNFRKKGLYPKEQKPEVGEPTHYPRIRFYKDGSRSRWYFAHEIVAETFLGEKQEGFFVNPIDGNKQNLRLDNLEYTNDESKLPKKKPYKTKEFTLKKTTCGVCQKDFETFHRLGDKKGIIRCKDCRRNRNRKYYDTPERKKKSKEWRLKAYYGMTEEDYIALLTIQNNRCAVCKKTTDEVKENLVIDHDHITGKVRGLLCGKCNRAIGSLGDNSTNLRAAFRYLDKSSPRKSWDSYFVDIAELVSTRSKDPSTQVGALLVKEKTIIATGYNGFPRGVCDTEERYSNRELKLLMMVHAEENAIINACRLGVATEGSTLYVTPLHPCVRCATTIVQSGVEEVVYRLFGDQSRWLESAKKASEIFQEVGIKIRQVE